MKIIASNFKTNHTRKTTTDFIAEVKSFVEENSVESSIYIFPPLTALDNYEILPNITIGVQNGYFTKNGSFTGEVGSEQLDEFSIKTILIGHSERRHILGESQDDIVKKYNFYRELGYTIIYCVGEPLEIKEQGLSKTLEYVFEQFNGIDTSYENLIIAYEPVWAIGTGKVATTEDIKSVHENMKTKIDKPILYGGSVKPQNLEEILSINSVDGSLIGTASWDVESFKQMIKITNDIK